MVVIDSSDSSSDEEDRRLKPIRRHSSLDYASRNRVFDVSRIPEGTSPRKFLHGLHNEQCVNNIQVPCHQKINKTRVLRGIFSNHWDNEQHIVQNIAKEIMDKVKSLEIYARQIEQVPSQKFSSKKLNVGLQLINEYVSTLNGVPNTNNQSNEMHGYNSMPEVQEHLDESYNPFEGKDFYSLDTSDIMTKNTQEKSSIQNKEDASCQTNISGDVIPKDISAALDFFQELIKNS